MKNADGRRVNWYETLLASSLRIPPTYDTLKSPEMRAIAYRMYIENNRESLVIDNLIGLLWVGSHAEAVKAEAHLKKITGQDFPTPGG